MATKDSSRSILKQKHLIQVKALGGNTGRWICLALFREYPEIRGNCTSGIEPSR
jgi:hypothetical protein